MTTHEDALHPPGSRTLRRQAEERLRQRRPELLAMSDDQVRSLVYELEVHQAEIEVQNEELRRAELELAEARNRYRDLYEFAPVGYLTLDREGNIEQVNLAGAELCGIARSRLIGRRLETILHMDDRDAAYLLLRDVAATGTAKAGELRLGRPGAEERWVHAEVTLHPATAVDAGGFRITLSDITERKHLEIELREDNRRKDEFLAMLSHELRNPLAALCSALHVQRLAGSMDGVTASAHEMMARQANHLVRLVDDLLDLSRITRGRIELRRERVDLAGLVREAVESSRPMIEQAGCRLLLDITTDRLTLEADTTRLAQVLSNLLDNAATYTGEGGEIRLSVNREGPNGVIAVQDNGIGIAAQMLPHVFDMFTQARELRAGGQRGLGIGLTLARGLVELHDGSVEARSDGLGKGSTFVLRLPLAADADAPAAAAPAPVDNLFASRRLLVVDDDHDVADGTGMLLRLLGAQVRVVYDGPSALEVCEAFHPTEVFLDLGMPDMDGFEVARRLRAQFPGEGFRLIALSGWGRDEDRRESRAAGFAAHLTKPVDVRALRAVLERRD